ncbi:diguanylate cyclase [Massilia sp. TS11]|uniref:GGDEF domain-containing protein n=1 Tax=Massilia sp. TS11 TaxID=2908003 RepID=UPI001ED9D2B1|nr:GGDEF domain-containing protein [Massilia sp. TS11]MCG2583592.1 GGDEF domain-containing protein [Massilia sp. TS11]
MLDLRTINAVTGIMGLLMACILLGMRHYYPRPLRGTGLWALSPLLGALSALAFGLEGILAAPLVAMLSNALSMASGGLNLFGSAAFYEQTLSLRRWLLFGLAALAALAAFMFIWPDYRVRVVLYALTLLVVTATHARLHWRFGLSFAGRLLAAILAVRCAVLLLRAVTAPFLEASTATRFDPGWIQTVYLASFSIGGMLTCLGVVLLASERVRADFERMANVDVLTGAATRRAALEALDGELARARRHGRPFSLLMLDIDHFKHINDAHGHATGDRVLAHAVAGIQSTLRTIDVVGRIGGEEFLILLPESELASASAVAERIRSRLAHGGRAAGLPEYTASIGCACLQGPDDSIASLMARADRALYAAKNGGRNRVSSAPAA